MKAIILVGSLVLNLNSAWAEAIHLRSDFRKNWSHTPLIVKSDKESQLMMKMFKRYLWIGRKPVQVAETNFTFLKNPQGMTDLKNLSETIKKSFPKNVLSINKNKNGYSLNGSWRKINRHIKIDLIAQDKNVMIITSLIRSGLSKALTPEVEELHSYLATYKNDNSLKNKTTFFDFFVPEVFADDPAPVNDFLSSTNSADTASFSFENYLLDVNAQMGTANSNWSNTNNQIDKANANWSNTNNQIDKANANWSKTNTELEKANANIDNANTNWAETNKVLAMTMDPAHMAKVAYFTAAGAALGSVSVNLALEGISAGVSFLYELITGTEKKKLEWQDFEKALQNWDGQLGELTKLEQIVDQLISAFDFFKDKDIGNNYIANLNLAMREMRFERDIMMEKFKDQNLNLSCRQVYYNAADEMDQKLKEYDKILGFATKNNITISEDQNYFCQQLKELQKKILSTESQIQDLRVAILKAESQFYDKNDDTNEDRSKKLSDINGDIEDTIERRKEYNQSSIEKLVEANEKERDEWVSSCVDAKNPEGKKIEAEIDNIFLHFFEAEGMCLASFQKNHVAVQPDAKSQKIFEAENKLRSHLKLSNNKIIDIKLSEEQLNWLTRIHMDAYCYQFSHAEEIPNKCKNFPEMLYSMSLSKGYQKASKAYQNRCEDRYLAGISNLNKAEDNGE
ncbi:MAG: hypothetical protein ACXVLQ_15480 [Bacteriovorax sp.]